MPVVYQGACTHCGQPTRSADRAPAVYRADGSVALLPHGAAARAIRRHGFTWARAAREGRIVRADLTVCGDCGALHRRQQVDDDESARAARADNHGADRLGAAAPPVPIALVIALTVAAASAVALDHPPALSIAAALAAMVTVTVAAAYLLARGEPACAGATRSARGQNATAQRVRALAATRRCGTCGGEHLTPIADAGDAALTRLRCPSCGQRALTLRAAGTV